MALRKTPLVEEHFYHVYTKSIAGFKVFNDEKDFERIKNSISFYLLGNASCSFSTFLKLLKDPAFKLSPMPEPKNRLVEIIAYCIMPTHLHFILKQTAKNGISLFMTKVLQSHAQYFNKRHKRKGPLWESHFKSIMIENDNYLLHLTRYIHLNPVSSSLVENPQDWDPSSYREYLGMDKNKICCYENYLEITPSDYSKFVLDRKNYQRQLQYIKSLTLE